MSEFRDAIGWAAFGDPIGDDDGAEAREAIGNDVLAMPEMQAIRSALGQSGWEGVEECGITERESLLAMGLPESVIDWVMGDDDER